MKTNFKNVLKEGIFPIGGFSGPCKNGNDEILADTITDEVFSLVKDCGINFIVGSNSYESEDGKRFVEMCNKYGIGSFVVDLRIEDAIRNNDFSILERNLKEWVDAFIEQPCCLGPYFLDEPNYQRFDVLEKTVALFRSFDYKGFEPYINLLPMVQEGPIDTSGKVTYEEYLAQFIERMKLPYTSYDGYPLGTGLDMHCRTNGNSYFQTLNHQAVAAQKYGIPFWAYIECGGQWCANRIAYDNYLDEGQFNWNINTCLAFGAKGLEYFTLVQPLIFYTPCKNSEISGLLGYTGKPNQWYYYAKRMNQFVQENSDFFLNSVLKTVIFLGASQQYPAYGGVVSSSVGYKELDYSESDHGIISVFEWNGKTCYYVVNNSFTECGYVGMRFNKEYDITLIDPHGKRKPDCVELREKNCLLLSDIRKGGAVIVCIE